MNKCKILLQYVYDNENNIIRVTWMRDFYYYFRTSFSSYRFEFFFFEILRLITETFLI